MVSLPWNKPREKRSLAQHLREKMLLPTGPQAFSTLWTRTISRSNLWINRQLHKRGEHPHVSSSSKVLPQRTERMVTCRAVRVLTELLSHLRSAWDRCPKSNWYKQRIQAYSTSQLRTPSSNDKVPGLMWEPRRTFLALAQSVRAILTTSLTVAPALMQDLELEMWFRFSE